MSEGKRPMVLGTRDFPIGCGRSSCRESNEAMDLHMKEGSKKNVTLSEENRKGRFVSPKRGKVKHLTQEESMELATQNRRQLVVANEGHKRRNLKLNDEGTSRHMQQDRLVQVVTPREKVLDILRLYREVFKTLDREKATRHGSLKDVTRRIDYDTRTALAKMGKLVNVEKMIGPVPGIEIGDEFQYKTELNVVGLHFNIQGGIDYMKIEGEEVATSIVVSEGCDYGDNFNSDVLIYTGEGGNIVFQNQMAATDQKLIKGNRALVNI